MRRRVGVLVATALTLASAALATAAPAAAGAPSAAEVARAQKRANQAAARLARAQSSLARAEQGLGDLVARTDLTTTRLSSLQGQVRSLAVNQYVKGGGGVTWVGRSDMGEASRGRTMLRYVSLVQTDAIDGYRVARLDLQSDRTRLERRLAEQRHEVAGLRAERARVRVELDRLSAVQRAYDAKLAADRKAAGARRPRPPGVPGVNVPGVNVPGVDVGRILGAGPWICPVQGPRAFSNDWGQPRSGGRSHQGNDILAPRGTPVVASVAGSLKPRSGGSGGIAYYLAGDNGTTYYGAHLNGLSGAAGHVAAGTVIGYVGTSGNAVGGPPHLHFEIHPGGGRPTNPFSILSRFC